MKTARWSLTALVFMAVAACADTPTEPGLVASVSEARGGQSERAAKTPTIVDVALGVNDATGEFSTLLAAVTEAGLVDALSAPGQRTVFAPTDAAFAALGLNAGNIGDVLEDGALTDILLYHVANGRRYAEDVVESDRIRMLNGGFNDITVTSEGVFIGEAEIIDTDIEAGNGVIHVIDAVLLPGSDEGDDDGMTGAQSPTIVDVALSVNAATGEFSTLLAAVTEAGLVDALSAKGQRTVFAPTDAAFAALGLNAGNIGDALEDEALTDILLYHVANGRLYAGDVVESDRIRMLNGGFNDIAVTSGGVFIGDAEIIDTDIEATNGVIHVIDAVLLPSDDD